MSSVNSETQGAGFVGAGVVFDAACTGLAPPPAGVAAAGAVI